MAVGVVEGTSGPDTIDAFYTGDPEGEATSDGADVVLADSGDDEILGLGGGDTLAGGANNDTIYAGSGNDTLFGGIGDDTLLGGSGSDVLNGDDGNDTINYSVSNAGVDIRLSTGSASGGEAQGDTFFDIENVVGSSDHDDISGDDSVNVIQGGGGDDFLAGLGGGDLIFGGDGNDQLIYSSSPTGVVVSLRIGSGFGGHAEGDILDGIEQVVGSDHADTLIGDDGNNALFGNDGNDILEGGLGVDFLIGQDGDDIYRVDDPQDLVDESFTDGTDTIEAEISFSLVNSAQVRGEIENLTLVGSADINGTGNALANLLIGNSGANTLTGGAGADRMFGGLGDDRYFVDDPGDVVDETGGDGNDTVFAQVSFTLGEGVENLVLDGPGDINGTGNALANVIFADNGANVLDGGAGVDFMGGLGGNDTYIVDNSGDVVDEAEPGSSGVDSVFASASFVLGEGVENLTLTGAAAINGTGNGLANLIIGNTGANILDGAGGADTLRGLGGNDTYAVDETDVVDEVAAGSGGVDTVLASFSFALGEGVENLTLTGTAAIDGTGNGLANGIAGNGGANLLGGGLGNDVVIGGAGGDSFVFNTAIKPKGSNVDTIADYSAAEDTILLDNAVFAKLKKEGGLKKKFFEVGKKADDGNDFIVYNKKTGDLTYDKNGDDKGGKVKFAVLEEGLDLSKADFFVV